MSITSVRFLLYRVYHLADVGFASAHLSARFSSSVLFEFYLPLVQVDRRRLALQNATLGEWRFAGLLWAQSGIPAQFA
jgi:hypothetical protein